MKALSAACCVPSREARSARRYSQSLLPTLSGEDGYAMILAVGVSAIVLLLGVVAGGLASHDTRQSAHDRKRLQSVAAAEAGINYVYAAIQTAVPASLPCGAEMTLSTTPSAAFTTTVTYDGGAVACPNTTGAVPTQALIHSVGRGANNEPARTMESLVNLKPVRGGALATTAIFSQTNLLLSSNMQITGGLSPNADVYTNGNFVASSGDVIQGSVYSQGSVMLSGSGGGAQVLRDVHAGGGVTLTNGFPVRGSVTSTTGTIAVGGRIDGAATAGGDVTPSNANVGGAVTRYASPQPSPPPTQAFPPYTYNPMAWTEAGYTIHEFAACAEAASFLRTTYASLAAAKRVVFVPSACTLTIDSRVPLKGNLSMLIAGGMIVRSNSGFYSDGGGVYDMALFAGLNDRCPEGNFTMQSNTNFGSGIRAVIRTPCAASFSSNGHILDGQIFAGSASFASNTQMTYYSVIVPGTAVNAFKEDIVYTREIAASR